MLDFDHGPFAHQALQFDMYSGSKQYPQKVQVQEEPLIISMHTVAATGKLPNAIKAVKKGDAKAAKGAAGSSMKATVESSTPAAATAGAPEDATRLELSKDLEDEVVLGATETINESVAAAIAAAGEGAGEETAPLQASSIFTAPCRAGGI